MKLKFYSLLLLIAIVATACDKGDDNENGKEKPVVETGTKGMFVVCEGNYYSGIDGSLSYLDYEKGTMSNNVFSTINGKSLGGTPNDMVECGGNYFIPVTEENLVWILDKDMKAVGSLQITKPRRVTAGNNSVFVSSYDGRVYAYNVTTKALTKSEVVGAYLEDIVFCQGFVYVCNAYNADYTYNTNVVKLNSSTLAKVKDITVVCNPTQIETDGKDVYVLSMGNYSDVNSMLQRIDADDKVDNLCSATYFAMGSDKIYYIASTYNENWESISTYEVYDLTTAKSAEFIDGKEIAYPAGIGVDNATGKVFVISYQLSEYGYGDYNSAGYVAEYDNTGAYKNKYTVGVCPKTTFFVNK
ncbi:MAG: hypothetical protein MJZ08_07305 [Bacteroidaceae bacterium]|nr:hypothetical protein [Bacteroidaceae bacterium]